MTARQLIEAEDPKAFLRQQPKASAMREFKRFKRKKGYGIDGLEIAPITSDEERAESEADPDIKYWALFVHVEGEGCWDLKDFANRGQAMMAAREIADQEGIGILVDTEEEWND